MLPWPLETITPERLSTLVRDQVGEGRTLEFKRQLPGKKDADIKEFLADVSAFANAGGGDLLYGVQERDGVAHEITGVAPEDTDTALLRLEDLIRSGLEPRVVGVRLHAVRFEALNLEGFVLIIRVPASFAAPHRVKFQNSGRFYTRNSRGKAEMDTHELRLAFTGAEGLAERFKALHEKAISQVDAGEGPVALRPGPIAFLSVFPLSYFREVRDINPNRENALWPPNMGSVSGLQCLEGRMMWSLGDDGAESIVTTNRGGYVDARWVMGREREGQRFIWPNSVEKTVGALVAGSITLLQNNGLDGPWMVCFSMIGINGYRFYLPEWTFGAMPTPSWRDRVPLPDLIIDDNVQESLLQLASWLWAAFNDERPPLPLGEAVT
jgi:hypothetical protein